MKETPPTSSVTVESAMREVLVPFSRESGDSLLVALLAIVNDLRRRGIDVSLLAEGETIVRAHLDEQVRRLSEGRARLPDNEARSLAHSFYVDLVAFVATLPGELTLGERSLLYQGP